VTTVRRASVDDLRPVPHLAGLPEDLLAWLADEGEVVDAAPGERLFNTGDPADHMFVVLSSLRAPAASRERTLAPRQGLPPNPLVTAHA
jgi:hypothetical protein